MKTEERLVISVSEQTGNNKTLPGLSFHLALFTVILA